MIRKLYLLSSLVASFASAQELPVEQHSKTHYKAENWALEINPFRLLIINKDWQSFSGTLTHFDNEEGVEIALPLLYSNNNYNDKRQVVNIDLHYRKYFTKGKTEGAYLGLFGRYTYLDGKVWERGQYATVHKFGLGGEIGVRIKHIFNTPFYWGASLMLGGYPGGSNDVFNDNFNFIFDDGNRILDIELLKIGYEF